MLESFIADHGRPMCLFAVIGNAGVETSIQAAVVVKRDGNQVVGIEEVLAVLWASPSLYSVQHIVH